MGPARSFDSEQGVIRWDVFGTGPPIILIHGTPFSSYIWSGVVAALSSRFEVYVWDLAGYGSSEQADGQDVSLAAQARILTALIDHWELERPAIVGHDFGGTVALRSLLLEGARFSELVLVDAVAVRPWGTGFYTVAKHHGEVLLQLPDPVHDGMVGGYVSWAAHHPLSLEVVTELVRPWTGPTGRRALYRQIAQNGQHLTDEIQDLYPTIDVPTLIVWGEQDEWLPLAQAHELNDLIPGSSLHTIPNAGHLVPLDAPEALAAEIVGHCLQGT